MLVGNCSNFWRFPTNEFVGPTTIIREEVRTGTGREAGLGHTGEICGLVT